MKEETEKKNRTISYVITTVVVALLLLLFFTLTITYEVPVIPQEALVEVEIIEPEIIVPGGSGSSGSTKSSVDVPDMSVPVSREQTTHESSVTQKTKPSTPTENQTPEDDNPFKNYKKSNNSSNNNNNGPDFGNDNNNNGGDNKGNTKGSGGIGHSFGDRQFIAASSVNDCGREGKVILDVEVSPEGNVRVLGVNDNSPYAPDCLENKAKNIASRSKFGAVSSSNNKKGTITILFKLSNF